MCCDDGECPNCAVCHASDVILRVVHLAIFLGVQAENIVLSFLPYAKSDTKGAQISLYVILPLWIIFSFLWIWSYIQTCWLDPGSVLSELQRLELWKDGELHDLPAVIAELPRCPKCDLPKPARAHHCSDCNRCYFRWDHHCPVVGNCIAHRNMKAFMLFLFYSCCVILMSGINGLVSYYVVKTLSLMFVIVLLVIDIVVSLWIGCFAWQYIPEVCVNRTTIERIAQVDPHTYDKGAAQNVKEVFGESCCLWFLPIPPAEAGFGYNVPDAYPVPVNHARSGESINEPLRANDDAMGGIPDEDEPPAAMITI